MQKGSCEKLPGLLIDQYEIVDGQQRIATVLILLKEIITKLEEIKAFSEPVVRSLKESYLRFQSVYKLELLGDDEVFFRRYIIEGDEPVEIQTLSQKRLYDAKIFSRNKLDEIKAKLSPEEFKIFLHQLMQKIEKMEVMVYLIKETSEAARIFELVNDRGKDLTNLEKTKSHLMYMVYLTSPMQEQERHLKYLNDCFGNIFRWIMEIQSSRFGEDIKEDDIQRYHFIIYAHKEMLMIPDFQYTWARMDAAPKYIRFLKDYIMRTYRADKSICLNFVLDYAEDLEKAFGNLKDILTYNENGKISDLLERILLLGRVANFYPLLLACWTKFKHEEDKLMEILRSIEVMIFRVYSIVRRRADTGRSRLYELAYKVHKNNLNYDSLVLELKGLIQRYSNDGLFEENLRYKYFYDRVAKDDIKYSLYEYERHLRKKLGEPLEFKLSEILKRDKLGTPYYEVEHISPKDPSELKLSNEELEEYGEYVDKLGNLTLASKEWNRRWGKKPFSEKRREYGKSSLRVQLELANYEQWGKDQIKDRENRLVKFALERWRI